MTARLAGRAAIVTGVGRGVGRALVQRLAADVVRVVALDLDAAAAAKTIRAADNAAAHAALACNVADSASVATGGQSARTLTLGATARRCIVARNCSAGAGSGTGPSWSPARAY